MSHRIPAAWQRAVSAVAFVLTSSLAMAQAPRPASAPAARALRAVAGKYEGITNAPNGGSPVTCELRIEGTNIVGTLRAGTESFEVTSGVVKGRTLSLNLGRGEGAFAVTGTLKDGRFEGNAGAGRQIVMTKVSALAP